VDDNGETVAAGASRQIEARSVLVFQQAGS